MPTTSPGTDRRNIRATPPCGDAGASPVVGFVLVLGIALTTMTIVFMWGAPTIDTVQSQQTAAAAEREFNTLAAEVESMFAGAPVATTPEWSPALTRGEFTIDSDDRMWAVGLTTTAADFAFGGLTDGDGEFQILNKGAGAVTVTPTAWRWSGAAKIPLYVQIGAGCNAASSIGTGGPVSVSVFSGAGCITSQPLAAGGFEIEFKNGAGVEVAHLSFLDVGYVRWTLSAGEVAYRQEYTNGAVLTGTSTNYAITKDPVISPPREESNSVRSIFIRLVRIEGDDGTTSASTGSTKYFLRNGGSYVRTSMADAANVQVYPPETHRDTWLDNFFARPSKDHCYTDETGDLDPYAKYPDPAPQPPCLSAMGGGQTLKVSVVHSTVEIEKGGAI